MTGYLDYWNSARAFGFIKDEAGHSYFVHKSAFPTDAQPIAGVSVEFSEGRTSKGAVALNVQIVQGGGN
jgi:cold shock CspA family protein